MVSNKSASNRTQSTGYVLIAVALFSITSLIAKYLGGGDTENQLSPVQISGFRFVVAFLAISLILFYQKATVKNVGWSLHISRSIFGWLGITCLFAAATQIPLADANAITFLSVIVTMVLSVYFLGEKVGPRRWTAALVALSGALLIARPGTTAFDPAAIIAFCAALFVGIEATFLKKLSDRDKPVQILFCNNLIGAAISLVALIFVWQTPTLLQWLLLIAIGVIILLAQFINILALQQEDASYLMPFWYATPVFAAVYDFLLFKEIVSFWSAVGIALIIMGGVVISIRTKSTPESEETHNKIA